MEYNTQRENLKLREYGRNVHRLVQYMKTVEDKDKRNVHAETMIELMKFVNPAMKESPEYAQKLWDDLFIMADYDLDIDSPFPKPEANLDKPPKRVAYPKMDVRFKHYGKNIELLVQIAKEKTDPEEKKWSTIYIGKLMKAFYAAGNRENIDDSIIIKNIRELSNNELDLDVEEVREGNLFEGGRIINDRPNASRESYSNDRNRRNNKGGKKNFKRRRPQ
ncbi:MAG: DUF4290 domain-containing protein [Cyclobacteriaceae bacterium]